jgi:hypothetical protein
VTVGQHIPEEATDTSARRIEIRKPRKTKNINEGGTLALIEIIGKYSVADNRAKPTTDWVRVTLAEEIPDWGDRFFRAEKWSD